MITKDTTLEELFAEARRTADDAVQSGEVFLVKDLFRGVEWKRIPRRLRAELGSMFFAHVNNRAQDVFEPLGKTAKKQQIYRKK